MQSAMCARSSFEKKQEEAKRGGMRVEKPKYIKNDSEIIQTRSRLARCADFSREERRIGVR
jgi:hypothetical protein